MPLQFASVLRACCVAGALMIGGAHAAEPKPSLVGATREQVLARFGEPKSQMVAGTREVLFFTGERVVLRNNVVIEADEIPIEPPPAPVSPPMATPTAVDGTNATGTATPADNVPPAIAGAGNTPAGTGAAAEKNVVSSAAVAPTHPAADSVQIISVRPPPRTAITPPQPVAAANAPATAVIKSVTVPTPTVATASSSPTPTPAPTAAPVAVKAPPAISSAPAAPAGTATPSAPAVPVAVATPFIAPTTPAPMPTDATSVGPVSSSAATSAPDLAATTSSIPATTPMNEAPAVVTTETATPAPSASSLVAPTPPTTTATTGTHHTANRPNAADDGDVTRSIFTPQTYLIAFILIGGGVGYLVWRSRERRIALVATAVSNSPFATATPVASSGSRFTPELLARLEWKRFEELVAAYYNKTGVVATRTKTGPASPVHVKISWKGEPRPFAFVQCVAHPSGLVDAKPIQTLVEVLAAENIRRGYVVTSGKFSVPARDLAEEKHITLLTGDIFLEKLNALPDAARNELMREATSGDNTTPSCPQCDVKMMRSPSDSSMWQCVQCGMVLPRE